MKRSSRRTWPPSADSIAPEWPSSRTARRSSFAEASGSWIGRRATDFRRGLCLMNFSCMKVLYARQKCTAQARSFRKDMKSPSVGKSTAASIPPLSGAGSHSSAVPAVSWNFVMSRRSQPSDGTSGKESCRSRYGASMYFTNCWAVSVTWPSASSTVIAVSSSGESLRSSWLLADHVEQCLALLVAHDLERAGQRVGQRRRVLDALGVAAGGAAHQLVVGRRLEVRERHGGRLDAGTRGRVALYRALDRVPGAVVEDHEQRPQIVRAGNEVSGGRSAEDVGAVADAADDGLVRRGQLGPEGRAQAPAEAAGRRRPEVSPRRAEAALGRIEIVLVHEDGPVVHEIADALRDPDHLEGVFVLRLPRRRGPRLAEPPVLGVPALRALTDCGGVDARPDGLGQRAQVQADRARQRRVGREPSDRVTREERIHRDLDDLR